MGKEIRVKIDICVEFVVFEENIEQVDQVVISFNWAQQPRKSFLLKLKVFFKNFYIFFNWFDNFDWAKICQSLFRISVSEFQNIFLTLKFSDKKI